MKKLYNTQELEEDKPDTTLSEIIAGIGQGLRTKVNANIGTSGVQGSVEVELAKLDAAVRAEAHFQNRAFSHIQLYCSWFVP